MQGLFGEIQPLPASVKREAKKADRKRKARLCYELTSRAWKTATYEFALSFLKTRSDDFIFEELTTAYEEYAAANNKPATIEKRAFAGLQHRLVKEELIEVSPGAFGRSYEGNVRPKYRRTAR